MAALAPRVRAVRSMVVAVADVDPLPTVCTRPPLVAINVAVVVEAEAGDRAAEAVPCEVVSTMSAAPDIAATAISEVEASVSTGGPRITACADARARTTAAHPHPGITSAAARQCTVATATKAG